MVYLAAFGGEWVETADEKNKLGQWHFEIDLKIQPRTSSSSLAHSIGFLTHRCAHASEITGGLKKKKTIIICSYLIL